jgi:signal transduction histidine kinase
MRFAHLDKRALRRWLTVFFLALALPSAVLVYQAYRQLKWEAFHQYRVLAEELADRIDARMSNVIRAEEGRSYTDYAFLVVEGDVDANFVQRSPLSAFPVASGLPGLIGHFQVDAGGAFSSPLLPDDVVDVARYGLSETELNARRSRAERIQAILSRGWPSEPGGVTLAEDAALKSDVPAPESRERRREGPRGGIVESDRSAPVTVWPPSSPAPSPAPSPPYAPASSSASSLATPMPVKTQGGAVVPTETVLRAAEFGDAVDSFQPESSGGLRIEDLELERSYADRLAGVSAKLERMERHLDTVGDRVPGLLQERVARTERSIEPQTGPTVAAAGTGSLTPSDPDRVNIFESGIGPFEFGLLETGHFLLYRTVWRDGRKQTQGAVVKRVPFLTALVQSVFRQTVFSRMSDLVVAYRGSVVETFPGRAARYSASTDPDLRGALLYRTALSPPFGDLELVFSLNRLPAGTGSTVVLGLALVLIVVLSGGFVLMYRLGARQIDLARQQRDFVSAISHELKTPLTSIRMYGEMLRAGWASEENKRSYYDYIHAESERLSRLISNVLQLARVDRDGLDLDIQPVGVQELMDIVTSKITSQIEAADFDLRMECPSTPDQPEVRVDRDAFTQIVINLVDNAIKFARESTPRRIDIRCEPRQLGAVMFAVRDYGPGVPEDQMKKIFRMFYRTESELTRETIGTGIGLALVRQLASAMDGRVDVVNRQPGAEFQITLPSR